MEIQKEKKAGVIRVILLIAAVVLLVFICWKAGWILNGNKNQVSEQEKQEAIQEVRHELFEEFQDAREELQEAGAEVQEELEDAHKEIQEALK